MKALTNNNRIMESGEAGVENNSGISSAAQKAELYGDVPYERLLRFAQLIGLTRPAPRPKLLTRKKKHNGGD